jgi:hypothetical protein
MQRRAVRTYERCERWSQDLVNAMRVSGIRLSRRREGMGPLFASLLSSINANSSGRLEARVSEKDAATLPPLPGRVASHNGGREEL